MERHLQQSLAQGGSFELATTKQAAEALGLSASCLNKWRIFGSGPPYIKLGHSVRYDMPTLRQWALSRAQSSTSARAA